MKNAENNPNDTSTIRPMSSGLYDHLKKVVQVYLPAFASLYFGLSQIWGLPAGEQVVGSIALLTTFLGVCLGISSKAYSESNVPHAGDLVVTNDGGGIRTASLELNMDPDDLARKNSVTFHVRGNVE